MRASWVWTLSFGAVLFSMAALSEPWMSSRFAQNCAACHAPGRLNLPPKERRCTLSCQGCHTNPNGGGLRNFYGKWTQERFLNSGYIKGYKLNKPRPEPTHKQFYTDERLKKYINGSRSKVFKKVVKEGLRHRETTDELPDSAYDKSTVPYKETAKNMDYFLLKVPQDDPWRQRRETYFNAGLDFRYFYMDMDRDGTKVKSSFPMATDVAVSVEPVHKLNLVVEGRFLNSPLGGALDHGFTSQAMARSAYVMVDDLPYNSFAMYGIYRPMFGNYNPDHTSLFAYATGLDQDAAFRAFSIGTAPNVPFVNLHYIMPLHNEARAQDKGMALNLGARFVTLGLYGTFSYWMTEADQAGTMTKKTMMSFNGGATIKFYTLTLDYTMIDREIENASKDKGAVLTTEHRFRFWKENYALFNMENLNTSRQLTKGKANQISFGISSFPMSSVEVQLLYKQLKETVNGDDVDVKTTLAQLHLFF